MFAAVSIPADGPARRELTATIATVLTDHGALRVEKVDAGRGHVVCRGEGTEQEVARAMFSLLYDLLDDPSFRGFSVAQRISWLRRCRVANDRGSHFRALIDSDGGLRGARRIEPVSAEIERPDATAYREIESDTSLGYGGEPAADDGVVCPVCGNFVDALVWLQGRSGGEPRQVCANCRADAIEGEDARVWMHYWHAPEDPW